MARILRPRSRLEAYPERNTFGATITFATSHALKSSARGRPASTYRNERTMNTVATREIPAARIHAYTGSPRAQSSAAAVRRTIARSTCAATKTAAAAIQRPKIWYMAVRSSRNLVGKSDGPIRNAVNNSWMSVPSEAGSAKRQKAVRPTQRNRRSAAIRRMRRAGPSTRPALVQMIQPRRACPTRRMPSAAQRLRAGFTGPSPPITFTKTARTRSRFVPRRRAEAIHRRPSGLGRTDRGRPSSASNNASRNDRSDTGSETGSSQSSIARAQGPPTLNSFRGGRYHFDDRARKAIPRVAVAFVGGIELVNPLLGILAVVLVTSAGAGAVLHAAGTPNPANAAGGEACGHEFNNAVGHNWTWSHAEAGEHDATSNHTNNAVCDRESGETPGDSSTGDHDQNETEDEASL